jgi:pyridoxamine 5'-phosphate oxidase
LLVKVVICNGTDLNSLKMKSVKRVINTLRKEYISAGLEIRDLAENPVEQFERWMEEAVNKKVDLPNAVHLATTGEGGKPSGRIVLLRGFDERGFIFFTSYDSRKGNDLKRNNNASMTFFWNKMSRQIRIEGQVYKVTEEESDLYFNSRPRESRLAAVASQQSRVLQSRTLLEEKVRELKEKYRNKSIPRPENWGGFYLAPDCFEFWQGRPHRLHDRVIYTKTKNNNWEKRLLYP